jgi:hypothetical protein
MAVACIATATSKFHIEPTGGTNVQDWTASIRSSDCTRWGQLRCRQDRSHLCINLEISYGPDIPNSDESLIIDLDRQTVTVSFRVFSITQMTENYIRFEGSSEGNMFRGA